MSVIDHQAVFYTFKQGAPLQSYLAKRKNFSRIQFTLGKLLTVLRIIICEEKLYDARNPAVIICSTELEKVLRIKAFHVKETIDIVKKQLILQPKLVVTFSFKNLLKRQFQRNVCVNIQLHYKTHCTAENFAYKNIIQLQIKSPKLNETFKITPNLYNVLATVPNFDHSQSIFTFKQISDLFVKYILFNHQTITHRSNPNILFLESNPLGAVFEMKCLHSSQKLWCLLKHLIRTD